MRIQLVAQLLISAYSMLGCGLIPYLGLSRLGCGLIPYLSQSHVWLLPNSLSPAWDFLFGITPLLDQSALCIRPG